MRDYGIVCVLESPSWSEGYITGHSWTSIWLETPSRGVTYRRLLVKHLLQEFVCVTAVLCVLDAIYSEGNLPGCLTQDSMLRCDTSVGKTFTARIYVCDCNSCAYRTPLVGK